MGHDKLPNESAIFCQVPQMNLGHALKSHVYYVRVPIAFVRHQVQIFPAERMGLAGGEIRKRHFVGAAFFGAI